MNAIVETSTIRPSPPGPRICVEANLPAFHSKDDAAKYRDQYCPQVVVLASLNGNADFANAGTFGAMSRAIQTAGIDAVRGRFRHALWN